MKTRQLAPVPWTMLGTALLIPLILQFTALLVPFDRMWGADALRYLPTAMVWAMGALPFLMYFVLRGMDIDPLRTPLALLLVALTLIPPIVWPVGTYFYGDGGLLIPQVHRFSVNGDFDTALMYNLKSSPLAGALLVLAMKAAPALGKTVGFLMPENALYPFRWISLFSLFAAVAYILRVSRGRQRLMLLLALGGSAGVLMYSGHVEFYAPVFAAVTVYLIAAERALTGKAPLWPMLLSFALALASHFMAVALLPALLFVIAARSEPLRRRIRILHHPGLRTGLLAGLGVIVGWTAVYFVAGFADSTSRIVMPVCAQESPAGVQGYTLFSSWHLVDMLNLVLLLAPAAFIALLWIWISDLREKKQGDGVEAFHAMNVLTYAGFAFFANASLGLGRDWDLLSPLGIIILLAALSAMRRKYDERAAVALAMISVFLLLPWTQLHRDESASADRFTRIMQLDEGHVYGDYALSGYDALRKFRHRGGDLGGEIALTQRMISILDYPQHYRELCDLAQLMQSTNPERTVEEQRFMLQRLLARARSLRGRGITHDYSGSMHAVDSLTQAIGYLALGNGAYGPVASDLEQIAALTRDGRNFPAIDGLSRYQQRSYAEAARHFEAALAEGFSTPNMYLLFGNSLALSQQYSASLSRFEEGVRKYPEDGMLRFTLAKYYLRARIQSSRAVELLRWCLAHENPASRLDEVRQLLGAFPEVQ